MLEFLSSIGIGALLGSYLSYRFGLSLHQQERAWSDTREDKNRDHVNREMRASEWRAMQLTRLEAIFVDFDSYLSTAMALRRSYQDAQAYEDNRLLERAWREKDNMERLHRELWNDLHRLKRDIMFLDDEAAQSIAVELAEIAEEFATGAVNAKEEEFQPLLAKYASQYFELKQEAIPAMNRIFQRSWYNVDK